MRPEFDLVTPTTLPAALELLAGGSTKVFPLAGGTNLLVDLRGGYHRPKLVVNLAKLHELKRIQQKNGRMIVGGCVTIAELLQNPLITQHASILQQAASAFANPLIRNRATVGGNLVNAAPCADTAPPLLALDAEVELSSQGGTRYVPLETFLVGAFKTIRNPDELLTAIRWPVSPPYNAGAFRKLGLRKVTCMAKVDVAVMLESFNGTCQKARIALGAVAPRHFRVHKAEEYLKGQALTADRIAEAARISGRAALPRVGSEYKRRVVEALTRRLLTQAAGALA